MIYIRRNTTKLNLQPSKKENISLALFVSTSAAYKDLSVSVVQVQTVAGDKIPISVLIVPNTETPLQNLVHTSLQNNPYLKGLQLAHPVTDNKNFEILVLNWGDYY